VAEAEAEVVEAVVEAGAQRTGGRSMTARMMPAGSFTSEGLAQPLSKKFRIPTHQQRRLL